MTLDSLPSFDESLGHKPTTAQRESRIGSIYEKYLYDPKDLVSQDPVIRALARKASQENKEQASVERMHTRATAGQSSAATRKPSQSGVVFAEGTKFAEGVTGPSLGRISTGSAYDGFGTLMDEYSDEDDSDNEGSLKRKSSASGRHANRDSWGARAIAVGHRPPDGASQNPPTLKLLGLKSQREGGSPIVASPRRGFPIVRNPANERSMSEYGDDNSRIGSTIHFPVRSSRLNGNFSGEASEAESFVGNDRLSAVAPASETMNPLSSSSALPSSPVVPAMPSYRSDSHKALTAQLGLDTPLTAQRELPGNDYFQHNNSKPIPRLSLASSGQFDDSFLTPPRPQAAALRSPTLSETSSRSAASRNLYFTSSPIGMKALGSPPVSPSGRTPLLTPPDSARKGSVHVPKPLLLCGDLDPLSPPPTKALSPVLGFSETPDLDLFGRKPSVFRRSVAFVTGNSTPTRPPSAANYRQSVVRRSMAFIVGKPTGQAQREKIEDEEDDEDLPPPRVLGFQEDPPESPREGKFLGARGDGEEWDADGAAAQFWRRFDVAQKRAELNDKDAQTSRTLRQRIEAQRKVHLWGVGIGGALILAAAIAIIAWRISLGNHDTRPGAVNQGQFVGTTRARRDLLPTATIRPPADLRRRGQVSRDLWVNARVGSSSPTHAAGALSSASRDHLLPAAALGPTSQNRSGDRRRMAKRHSHLNRAASLPFAE